MKIVDLEVIFQTQSEGAVCINEVERGPDIWVPKSRCQIDPVDPDRGDVITLSTDEGMAAEKDLI